MWCLPHNAVCANTLFNSTICPRTLTICYRFMAIYTMPPPPHPIKKKMTFHHLHLTPHCTMYHPRQDSTHPLRNSAIKQDLLIRSNPPCAERRLTFYIPKWKQIRQTQGNTGSGHEMEYCRLLIKGRDCLLC